VVNAFQTSTCYYKVKISSEYLSNGCLVFFEQETFAPGMDVGYKRPGFLPRYPAMPTSKLLHIMKLRVARKMADEGEHDFAEAILTVSSNMKQVSSTDSFFS